MWLSRPPSSLGAFDGVKSFLTAACRGLHAKPLFQPGLQARAAGLRITAAGHVTATSLPAAPGAMQTAMIYIRWMHWILFFCFHCKPVL